MSHSNSAKFDIAILGGGILGCATAYFLLKDSPTLSVCVIEPDPTYEFASTLRASGGCRVQFTWPENIAMSLYSIGFIIRNIVIPAQAGIHVATIKVKMDPRLRGDDDTNVH